MVSIKDPGINFYVNPSSESRADTRQQTDGHDEEALSLQLCERP